MQVRRGLQATARLTAAAMAAIAAIAETDTARAEAPAARGGTTPLPMTAEQCLAAADRGQLLRDEGKLMASRAELATCGAESCPAMVRRECVRWLEEMATRIPTVILAARDAAGRDLPNARLSLDGAPLSSKSAGRSLELDPGPHTVRAELAGQGAAQESFVLREKERDRVVAVVLRSPGATPVRLERRVPVLSWVLGGVAVAGGVGFGVFWLRGMSDVDGLRATCAPYCTERQIDDVRPTLDIARISGAVGIGAAVSAVAVYFLTSPKPVQRATATVQPDGVAFSF